MMTIIIIIIVIIGPFKASTLIYYSPTTLSSMKMLVGGCDDTWHSYSPASLCWTNLICNVQSWNTANLYPDVNKQQMQKVRNSYSLIIPSFQNNLAFSFSSLNIVSDSSAWDLHDSLININIE